MTTRGGQGNQAVVDATPRAADNADEGERDDDDAIRNGNPAGDVAIAVEGVSKQFGSGDSVVTAVDDVSFEVEAGSIVGLLGPNGAGKTTLIKSTLGMVLPDEGRVRIAGFDIRDQPRAAYAHVDAMLEGARNDYWRLTVRENLRYFATVGGINPDSVADRHERLLDRLELTEKADVAVRKLSRGMKQKVSLASTLAGGADVVFLDEPTLGLDVESSRTLQRELRRLAEEEGLTVVLSSHDMDVVETVCDRVLIMSGGRIIADDTVEELLRGDGQHGFRITSRDLDTALLADLRRRFEVAEVEQLDRDRGARVTVTADSEGLYTLLAQLRNHGVTLERVTTVDPDLEDVFVTLTTDDADGGPALTDGHGDGRGAR
jgi:ABC-2 type transport system ATP-binding protein